MSFLILSLPRSRSAWLAHFLSFPGFRVGHEILVECDCFDKLKKSYEYGMDGTVETAGQLVWRLVRKEIPDCKIVLVRRPLIEVYRSMCRIGVTPDLVELAKAEKQLDSAALDEEVSSIDYQLLSEPWACAKLFEHCLGLEPPFGWVIQFIGTNIQVNLPEQIDRVMEGRRTREKLEKDVERLEKWTLN